MNRVVLDTNVLVSGLLSATGPCGRLIDLVVEGLLQPCVDSRILGEYELKDLLPAFVKLLEQDPSSEVRAAATTALGVYVYLGEVEELRPAVLHQVEESLLSAYRGDSETLVRRRALDPTWKR